MTKYHIKKDGTPGICHAKEGNCPLGGPNNHFDSLSAAQNEADKRNQSDFIINREEIQSKIDKLESELPHLTGFDVILTNIEIQRNKYALEGKDYDKELEKRKKLNEESKAKDNQEQLESDKNAKNFAKLDKISLPSVIKSNYVVNRAYSPNLDRTWRGEKAQNANESTNTGTALYGQGRYTTTNHSYAKKFGIVRKVNRDELPSNPLRLKNQAAFQLLEQKLSEENNVKYGSLFKYTDPSEVIKKMGYDGLTIGTSSDMIIVKY